MSLWTRIAFGLAAALWLAAAPATAAERVPEVSATTSGGLTIQDLGTADENVTVGLTAGGLRWLVLSTTGLKSRTGCDPPVRDPATNRFQTTCTRVVSGQPVSNAITVAFDAGDDILTPGPGLGSSIAVHAVGGRGNDQLNGGPGPDELEGGDGNDRLDGNEGDDELDGDDGNDTLTGDGGTDDLRGDAGNDRLLDGDEAAAPGADDLRGGSGDDSLRAGVGNDHVDAGSGDDTVFDDDGPAPGDTLIPDVGVDMLSYRNFPGVTAQIGVNVTIPPVSVNPSQQVGFEGLEGTAKNDELSVGSGTSAGAVTLLGLAGRDRLESGFGPDLLVGGAGVDDLRSHLGNDVIDAKTGESSADDPDELIDLINCGGGPEVDVDTAISGLTDPFGRDHFDGCENVEHSAIGEGPHVELAVGRRPALADGELTIGVGCPRKLHHACRGSLVAAGSIAALERAKATRYKVRAGRDQKLVVEAGPGVRRGRRAYVQSVEEGDVKGQKTTRRLVKVSRG